MPDTHEYTPLEGLPVPALVVREDKVVFANPAFLSLLGIGMDEVRASTGMELLVRFSPEDRGWMEPMQAARLHGEPVPDSVWTRVRVQGGERTFCLRRGNGVRPEDTLLILLDAEGEDNTRRLTEALVKAAGELVRCRDEREVLETAVEAIHQQGFFVSVLILEGDVMAHGPYRQRPESITAIENRFGCPLPQVRIPLSASPHLAEVFSQRKAAFHMDVFHAMEKVHRPEVLAQLRRSHPVVRALDMPIFVEGEPWGLLAVQGETLTPASAATLELFARQVGGALENVRQHRLAASRLTELTRLQAELVDQERLTVLGEAAGVVAHEVRNPLGAIINAVAVLKREKLGPTGSMAAEMLVEEATRLDVMVRDLLDVVRPLEPRPRPLHLGELAQRTVLHFQERRQSEGIRWEVDEEAELPLVEADETLLQMALENLVRHAVDSSPRGGLVRVGLARAPAGVRLSVEDEGPGVSQADAPRLFEPFFTTRTNGTGLGLAVVRRVVVAHGGTVQVSPRPERGMRFELHLPLTPPAR
jgi:signal transduction histidine kinase